MFRAQQSVKKVMLFVFQDMKGSITVNFLKIDPTVNSGVMVKVLNCGIVVCEFELQSRFYVHFRANTLGKVMKPLILLAMG